MDLSEGNKICWEPNYNIQWEDYRGIPDNFHKAGAMSYISMNYEIIEFKDKDYISIAVCFDGEKSWVKQDAKLSSMLLKHEYGHFDLNELYARYLRRTIKSRIFSKNSYDLMISSIYDSVCLECSRINEKYDLETNFSRDTLSQFKWNNFIYQQLRSTEKYSDTLVKLKIE